MNPLRSSARKPRPTVRQLQRKLKNLKAAEIKYKETIRNLRQKETAHQALFENIFAAIVWVDLNGIIQYVNRRCEEMFGFSREEIIGKYFLKLSLPEDLEASFERFEKIKKGEVKQYQIERKWMKKDRSIIWTDMLIAAVPDELGHIQMITAALIDTTDRKQMESQLRESRKKLRENEQYLSQLLDTMKTGVMVVDPASQKIMSVNRHAALMIGLSEKKIIRQPLSRFIIPSPSVENAASDCKSVLNGAENYLLNASGSSIPILTNTAEIERNGQIQKIECFADIRILKKLLDEQEIDIQLAKKLLMLINGPLPRYVEMKEGASLFVSAYAVSCHKEGGDHYFLKTFQPTWIYMNGRTMISLKDQSGHQVGCILRSIITDLIHQTLLHTGSMVTLDDIISRLNTQLIRSGIFEDDDFLTAVNCEIDHDRRRLRFISCGHPKFLLIRNREVMLLPDPEKRDGSNPPLGVFENFSFSAGEMSLLKGDKIIFYTDGLLETLSRHEEISEQGMPSPEDLKKITEDIISNSPSKGVEKIVSLLLCEKKETSESEIDNCQPEDDVTVIGVEIEDRLEAEEDVWFIKDRQMLQKHIDSFIDEHQKKWEDQGFCSPFRLQICFEEALVNAWKHGNRKTAEMPLIIRHRYGNDFHIDIIDAGKGFDLSCIPDPRDWPNRLKSYGRGVYLINKYADHAEWKAPGNHLSFAFQKQPAVKSSDGFPEKHPFNLWEDIAEF